MMIATNAKQMREQLQAVRSQCIAFVPTMGCLHGGHISLIRKARTLADMVVVSIYVNPLQFGENEDFGKYPRVFEQDAEICKKEGVNFIFHPHNLYPDNGSNITLKVRHMSDMLCGASRPGHFDGVVTVVNMLFNIIQPDIAIFGEKDWQQLAIIRRMVSDLHMPVEILGSNIVREKDGLAMSSRNRYLSAEEREKALVLSQTLEMMKNNTFYEQKTSEIVALGLDNLKKNAISPEYLEIRNELTLQPESTISPHSRIFIAAKIGSTRLIDNAAIQPCMEKKL